MNPCLSAFCRELRITKRRPLREWMESEYVLSEGDQSGRRDILFAGEALKTFVDDIAVFQADDENAAEGCL